MPTVASPSIKAFVKNHVNITPGLSFLNSSSYNITVFETNSNNVLYQNRGLSIPKYFRSLEYIYEKRKGKIRSVQRLKSDMKTLRTAIWFSLAKISSLETRAIEVFNKVGNCVLMLTLSLLGSQSQQRL